MTNDAKTLQRASVRARSSVCAAGSMFGARACALKLSAAVGQGDDQLARAFSGERGPLEDCAVVGDRNFRRRSMENMDRSFDPNPLSFVYTGPLEHACFVAFKRYRFHGNDETLFDGLVGDFDAASLARLESPVQVFGPFPRNDRKTIRQVDEEPEGS